MENKKFIPTLIVCLLLVSCGTDIDYGYSSTVIYENHSSHEITVSVGVNDLMVADFTLTSGESIEFNTSGMGDICPPLEISLLPHEAFVWFDKKAVMCNRYTDDNTPHNICRATSYETIKNEKRAQKYRYIFTDEDYEYALANPVDKYIVTTQWVYKNDSSSDIVIVFGDWHDIEEYNDKNSFLLPCGKNYKLKYQYYVDIESESKYQSLFDVCSIVVGNTPYLVGADENIRDVANYTVEELGLNNFRFTYTFTDEILEQLKLQSE